MFLKYIIVTSNPYVHTQFTTHGGVNYSMELSAILKLVFVATHLVCITSSNSIVQDFLSLADVWQNNIDTNVEAGQIHKRQAGDSCSKSSVTSVHDDGTFVIDIRFPHAEISHDDDYLCTSMSVPNPEEESYITKFIPEVSSKHAHHMLLYGCEEPYSDNPIWPCMMSGKCRDGSPAILYAWARDAAPLSLPPDVGYRIGGSSGIKSLVLQIHFAHKMSPGKFSCAGMSLEAATKQPKYFSGIYLLGSGAIAIPPHGSSSATASCVNKVKPTLNVFAFRTHAHNLGTVITAYRVRDGVTKMIGKGNPLWPQAFYSRVGGSVDIRDDDVLLARCDYKSDRDRWTSAGEGGGDEMCNFYMMYYTDNKQVASTAPACWNNHLGHNLLFRWDAGELAPFPGYAGADSIKAIESGRASQPRVPHTHLDQHIHTNREQLDDRELFEEDQLLAETSPHSDAVQVVDENAQERPAVGKN